MYQNTLKTTASAPWLRRWLLPGVAVVVSACQTMPPAPPSSPPAAPSAPAAPAPVRSVADSSQAGSARAYRQDGAMHLYTLNIERIYQGRMQPLLYAIGVIDVEIDRGGKVIRLEWTRAPTHAPEVMAEIERTIRQASPFPAPVRLGRVVYTETWLWDKSGRFQLDTLTEGQN